MGFQKFSFWMLAILVFLSLLTPVLVSRDLLFPFVTTKAFYFRIVVELALPFYVFLLCARRDLRPSLKQPLNIFVLLFLLFNLVSALFGVNVIKSLWGNFERMGGVFYLAHLTLLYFYLQALAKYSPRSLELFLKISINLSVFLVFYGMLMRFLASIKVLTQFTAYLTDLGLGFLVVPDPSLPARSSITFGNPIYVGSFLIIPFFLSIFFALQADKIKAKIWWWLTALIELVGIYYSGTRGAIVGLVLGIFLAGIVYLILEKKQAYKIAMSVVLSLFLAGTFMLFALGDKLPHNVNFARIVKLNDSNSAARLIQWKLALEGYKDRPVLGTGSENYYVISSAYHNPEIYKYDRSWFDKPHNFLLEILVTTGIFGFLGYLGIIIFSAWGLFQAYRREVLGLPEFAVLFACVLVYQIQNLFVFDSIAASMMFFVFLAFAAFLTPKPLLPQAGKKQPVFEVLPWHYAVFGLSSLAAFGLLYAGNISPAIASKNTNYGYAYSSVDLSVAKSYFEKAIASPYNFDRPEMAMKFSDVALDGVRQAGAGSGREIAKSLIDEAQKQLEEITASQAGNNPIYWQKLAQIYLTQSYFNSTPLNSGAEEALRRAIDLSPKRTEARIFYGELLLWQNKPGESVKMFREVVELDPTNFDAAWELTVAENAAGQTQSALNRAQTLLKDKNEPKAFTVLAWMIDYYKKNNDLKSAALLYEHAADLRLLDLPEYKDLFGIYAVLGQKDKAAALADYLKSKDPSLTKDLQEILGKIKAP